MTKLSDATRNKLKTVSTATVATALFKRGFRIQMIQDVHPLGPDQPVLVGEAFTLRYMPAREDLNKIDVFRDRAHPQRKAIEDCPPGAVLVMVGGGLYTLGALIYAAEWPNPFPRTLGFHEIFHLLVVAAAVTQFVAVSLVVM